MRVLRQASLFEAVEVYAQHPTDEGRFELARWIFDPGEGDHSIFMVDNVDDVSRVVVAYALAHRERLQARAVVWGDEIDLDTLRSLGKVRSSAGMTPDNFVNDRHYDICGATDRECETLTEAAAIRGYRRRWNLKEIKAAAKADLQTSHIDRARLKPKMVDYLDEENLL